MRREIEDRVVVDHEDDRMPRRRGAALRDMRVHDGRAGDRPTVERPVPRLGVGERAELSRQALVRGPGDRRHDAHETVGASGIPKVSRPELGLGPTTRFIEHVRSLARPPEAAKSARDMRSLDGVTGNGNIGKTGGKTPNGKLPPQIDINNFNKMPEASILQA